VYPDTIQNFLHPFFTLLAPPDPSSSKNFDPTLLTIHILTDIALEVHDSTMKSARTFTPQRQQRDGAIRDAIRTTGDERLAIDGLLNLAVKGLDIVESGRAGQDRSKWINLIDQAVKTLAAWTRE
jgi:exportin-T